ncbi:hypothetical protein GWK47_054226 [Chionoecetes opilio]|uniref:Uncharacterized protein n=1 Tax=Chionoecetes opilio TaxID=41210 RepID=A0A8J4Y6A0_CHIOP|nr:hypothetical protein GWK47_054226 [Chionoecetes opilio]
MGPTPGPPRRGSRKLQHSSPLWGANRFPGAPPWALRFAGRVHKAFLRHHPPTCPKAQCVDDTLLPTAVSAPSGPTQFLQRCMGGVSPSDLTSSASAEERPFAGYLLGWEGYPKPRPVPKTT